MYKYIKRILDFILASLFFIITLPVFIIIAILVKIKIGSPIFFKQERTGYKQKRFYLIKFRTMTNQKDKNGNLLPDEQRLTKFGKFLRSTSLDELPEILAIIKGDMSIIGPRPLPSIYDDYYTENEKKRFNVRGGLVPPSNFKSKAPITDWNEQLSCEVYYAENVSFILDFKNFINVFGVILDRNKRNYGSYVRKPLNIERKSKLKGKNK